MSYPSTNESSPQPSFLAYQKSSSMQMLRNEEYVPKPANAPLLFKKPEAICDPIGQTLPIIWRDKFSFSREWRSRIEANVKSFGLELKIIRDYDTPLIKEFLERRYPKHISDEISPFDLWRFRRFGHGIILQAPNEEIMGTIFEVGYDTIDKTSFTIRLAVDEQLKGNNLGYHLMIYSSLLAMEHGSRVKRGLIQMGNLRSLYINLNKVGWICDGYLPNITGLGAFFEIALPLDPMGLTANVIEQDALIRFIHNHREQEDFLLIEPDNQRMIETIYAETDFKVSAVIKPGGVDDQYWLVALPAKTIQLEQIR